MKQSSMITILSTLLATMLLGATDVHAAAGPSASESALMDLLRSDAEQQGLSDPLFLEDGQAVINLVTGQIRLAVEALPVATGPTDVEFGQDNAATAVKGTLVCNASAGVGATLIHTPVIPVRAEGGVTFTGEVTLPAECVTAPHDLAFFLRTLEGDPESE